MQLNEAAHIVNAMIAIVTAAVAAIVAIDTIVTNVAVATMIDIQKPLCRNTDTTVLLFGALLARLSAF